jgi:hypothetical protein
LINDRILTLANHSSYKSYYASYLQVVFGLSVARAGYICNIFNIVSCTWAVLISVAFKYTDTYKWGAIVALPIQILMTGLLIKFRQPGTHIGLLVMVEVIWAMCAAMMVQIEQVAVMAAVPHENVATGLALLLMITSIGGSVGGAISGALWTNIVPKKLAEYLPADKKGETIKIYGDIVVQLSYPWDSPERQAIVRAYGDAQKIMVIVGTCALVPCFLWVIMLKNYRLSGTRRERACRLETRALVSCYDTYASKEWLDREMGQRIGQGCRNRENEPHLTGETHERSYLEQLIDVKASLACFMSSK